MALRDPRILEQTLSAEERAVVDELSRRVHDRYGDSLERLVVFGSRARGDARDDSDIDLLVVLRMAPGSELDAERTIWGLATEAMAGRRFAPLSIVVLSADRFLELLHRERRFALDVAAEGIAL